MKRLRTDIDRQVMLRIEAARVTHHLIERAISNLRETIGGIHGQAPDFTVALIALENAWAFVDQSHRYATVVSQIRGFKHKDERYKAMEKVAEKIGKMRNYIQHLNSEIPKTAMDIYPISGALSWPSGDRKQSQTLSVGMMPEGSQFHSLSYDIEEKSFTGGVTLYAARHQLDIDEALQIFSASHEYLSEWLEAQDFLQEHEANPSYMSIAVPEDFESPNGERFFRARFEAGGQNA